MPLAPRRRAASPAEAAAAAAELGFPVAVKVDGPAHKAREGGVVLGVESAEAAAAAAERLGGRVLVARQVPHGPEAVCGFARDPDYGPVLAVGLGGVGGRGALARRRRARPRSTSRPPARSSRTPRAWRAIASPAACDDLATTLVALGRLALEHPEVEAVDVNPLILGPDGAVAVDALVVTKGAP